MKPFEAQMVNGEVQIFVDGLQNSFLLDSKEGFEFAQKYLEEIGKLYPHHIAAIEEMLRTRGGETLKQIKQNRMLYVKNVAHISLSCCFGIMDNVHDRDKFGRYAFEMCDCPLRKFCRFNGYNPAYKDKKLVICNPVIDLGFTKTEAAVAHLLVNTTISITEIAAARCVSLSATRNMTTAIYKKAGVKSRDELRFFLDKQRII